MRRLPDENLRRTLAFVRREPEPPTAADVAHALRVPRSVARWRLERLVEAGLLVPEFARRSGRRGPGSGRPAKTYAVPPGVDDPDVLARNYPELVRLLVAALPARSRDTRLAHVGRAFGRELVRQSNLKPAVSPHTAARRICRGLGRLGFQTSAQVSADALTFVTPTCPLRPLVVADEGVGEVDRAMWECLVAASLGRSSVVRCETHDCLATDSPCRVVVELART